MRPWSLLRMRDWRSNSWPLCCSSTRFIPGFGFNPVPASYRVPNHRHVIIDSKDKYGVYVHLELEKTYTQDEVVAAIQPITPGTPVGPKALRGNRAS